MDLNSQEILWGFVGSTWWTGYAIICSIAGVLWFRFIARSPKRDALTLARLIMLGGFILGAFVRFNSACQPLSAAFLATGAAFSALLLTCNWCGRPGGPKQKILAIIREIIWRDHDATSGSASQHGSQDRR